MKKLRIVFLGTAEFAVPSLEALLQSPFCEVVGVVTAPDKPAGRGLSLTPSPVKRCALAHNLPLSQPEKLRDVAFLTALKHLAPDLHVVVAFRMLPEVVWAMPPLGSINLHASLLPDYRGAAPIHWAVINGETETGVTTFKLEQAIDTGQILLQRRTPIGPNETTGQVYERLMRLGAQALQDTVQGLAEGTLTPTPQRSAEGRPLAPKLTPENTRIQWRQSPEQVTNFCRGLAPQPAAWTLWGDRKVKIYRAQAASFESMSKLLYIESDSPGQARVIGKHLYVRTLNSWIEIQELQVEGKRQLPVDQFINGLAAASLDLIFT